MKKFKRYLILGDIHGRKNWADLVTPFDEDTLYIFIGDYTDPYYYEGVSYNQMMEQLLLIIQFKKEHPDNVLLLVGNHDLQYIINDGETNRYDVFHAERIAKVFSDNADAFYGVAYQIGEKYLISHAGVTSAWYEKWIGEKTDNLTLEKICDDVNKLWEENKKAFLFTPNAVKLSDYYGTSPTHGPLWIRPTSLWEYNIFGFGSGKIQVVGHTRFEHYLPEHEALEGRIVATGTEKTPLDDDDLEYGLDYWINDGENKCKPKYNDNENPDIIQIDCLAAETACLEINGETLEWTYKLKDE